MDKKKKIITLIALALVGGFIALNSNGSFKNLKSDVIWIETGDGNGYYAEAGTYDPTTNSYSNYDPATRTVTTDPLQNVTWQTTAISPTNFSEIKELRNKIIKLNADIAQKKGDEKTEGTIKYYEKQIKDLKNEAESLQKNVDNANKNLSLARAAQDIPIDVYMCTKNSAIKNAQTFDGKRGYAYISPGAFMNRIGDGTKINPGELTLAIQRLDTQIQNEKLALSRIKRSNTSAVEKQKKAISSLEEKRRLAESEKNALKSDIVITKCYQPALAMAKKAEPAIADAKKVVDEAQNKLQENTDKIKTIEEKISESQNTIKQLEDQISIIEKVKNNLEETEKYGNNNCPNGQIVANGKCTTTCTGFPDDNPNAFACWNSTIDENNTSYTQTDACGSSPSCTYIVVNKTEDCPVGQFMTNGKCTTTCTGFPDDNPNAFACWNSTIDENNTSYTQTDACGSSPSCTYIVVNKTEDCPVGQFMTNGKCTTTCTGFPDDNPNAFACWNSTIDENNTSYTQTDACGSSPSCTYIIRER